MLTFFHELGHASAIIHFGRRVKSAGFMIYFGSPAFFVEASDSLMLDRHERILESFAGPFAELVLAGVASLVLASYPGGTFSQLLYKFAVINYFVIFLNLIPLLELDGYWILSDLIQVPDLRPRSLEFFQHDLWHKLRTRERLSAAGGRARPVRGRRRGVHDLQLLHRLLLLEADLRRSDLVALERGRQSPVSCSSSWWCSSPVRPSAVSSSWSGRSTVAFAPSRDPSRSARNRSGVSRRPS